MTIMMLMMIIIIIITSYAACSVLATICPAPANGEPPPRAFRLKVIAHLNAGLHTPSLGPVSHLKFVGHPSPNIWVTFGHSVKRLVTLTFDLSTCKWNHGSAVSWASFLPALSLLCPSIFDLGSSTGQAANALRPILWGRGLIITSCARGNTICPRPSPPPWASKRLAAEQMQRSTTFPRRIRSHADCCSRLTR